MFASASAVLLASVLVAGAAAAEFTPEADSSSDQEAARIQSEQAPYFEARTIVRSAIDAAGTDMSGAPMAIDDANHAISMSWVGKVPEWLSDAARKAESATGVAVRIGPAEVTNDALLQAARAITDLDTAGRVASVDVGPDALTVNLRSDARRSAYPALDTEFEQQVEVLVDSRGIDVNFAVTDEEFATAARFGDTTNFRGGSAYYQSVPGGVGTCTMGFPAQLGSTLFIVTAAHCSGYLDGRTTYGVTSAGGQGNVIGQSDYVYELNDGASHYDLGLVRLSPSKLNLPSLYADPMTATLTVRGYDAGGILTNATYCSSGYVSVAKCNVKAGTQAWVCDYEASPAECFYIIRVSSSTPQQLFCPGDSGGPIYFYQDGFGSNRVTAAGIVSGTFGEPLPSGCGFSGGISVVATAVSTVPGLQIRYQP